jgi:hypothetical protein
MFHNSTRFCDLVHSSEEGSEAERIDGSPSDRVETAAHWLRHPSKPARQIGNPCHLNDKDEPPLATEGRFRQLCLRSIGLRAIESA